MSKQLCIATTHPAVIEYARLSGLRVRLTEEAIAEAIERRPSGDISGLHIRHRDQTVPVRAIAADNVASQFGFVQSPQQPVGEQECS